MGDQFKKEESARPKPIRFIPRISLMLIAFLVCAAIYAQTDKITVNGTVVDTQGEPLIGASVREKGSTNAIMTGVDGDYSLSVSPNATLEISYIGFIVQNILVNGKQNINITLQEDSRVLDEVVVTALGIKREAKALGYAMTELKGDDLDNNVINPVSALQGKAAGVYIAGSDGGMFGSSKIQIRGASTLGKNNQPIYVIDGVILDNSVHHAEVDFESNSGDYGNELKNLNPNDFETVSILKGAAATALYGSRGLNGAIVITTKGGGNQKGFGVSFNQSIGIETINTLPKFQTEYGHGRWASTGATRRSNPWNTNDFEVVDEKETIIYGGNYWGPKYDGRQVVGYDGVPMAYSPNKNYYKDMFDTGLSTNTNVVVQGGNDKTTFYNSLGYLYAKGIVANNEFSKLSNMLKATHKVSDRVTLGGSFTFSISEPKNPQLSLGERAITNSVGPMYNTKYYKDKYKGDNHTGIASLDYGDKYARVPNKEMWWAVNENSDTRSETVIRPTLDLDVRILDWLNFKAEANMNYYFTSREIKNLGQGYMNRGTNNELGGKYLMEEREKKQQTIAGAFIFNKKVSDFNFGGFLRGEYYNYAEKYLEVTTEGGLVLPGEYFLGNTKKPQKVEGKYKGKKRILSTIAAANISWKDQVYLDITGRNDWSSAMVKTDGTGDHSFFYPSVSGSWIATETFRGKLPASVSFLKLRASWAQVGNDTDAYSIIQGYNVENILQSDGNNIHTQAVPDKLIQNNIKPEIKTSWEVGADLRFFDDRLGLDVAYYKENTKNQIMTIDKAPASGVKSYLVNAGDIQNQGVEIALRTIPFQNKDWRWSLDLTYTRNRNKIKKLHESAGEYIVLAGFVNEYNFRIGSVAKVGGAYGTLMSDILPAIDANGNKVLSYYEAERVGYYERANKVQDLGVSINPDFLGSVATGLQWKDFTFNALLDFRYGGYIASYSNRYSMAYGLHNNSLFGRDTENGGITFVSIHDGLTYHDGIIPEGIFGADAKVTPPGAAKEISLEGLSYQEAVNLGYIDPAHASAFYRYTNEWQKGTVNDNWLHKVKYIALREVSLGYKVPKTIASKIGARGLRVGVSARNLGYLYNSLPNNLNPEAVRGSAAAEFRERGFTPNRASYTLNIGIDF